MTDLELRQVALVTRDADALSRFYTDVMGMRVSEQRGDSISLGFGAGPGVLRLLHDPSAQQRPAGVPGLFHTAFLYRNRAALATALRGIVSRGWPVEGAADHGVSEAIYLSDPDGNGIEIYADRPRAQWPYSGGMLQMFTAPLDMNALLAQPNVPAEEIETRIGHVHLQVSSLEKAEAFWCHTMGLEATQTSFPGALFVSAGGYHHHIGLNTWRSRGMTLPSGSWTGLHELFLGVPDAGEFSGVRSRLTGVAGDTGSMTLTTAFETTHITIHLSSTTHRSKELS